MSANNWHTEEQRKRLQQIPTSRFVTRCRLGSCLAFTLLLLLLAQSPQCAWAVVHPVQTYKNASTQLGQLVTSSTLVWESYDRLDPKQLQYAVEGGKYITDEEHYPIYVCHVRIAGLSTIGHTEKIGQSHVCVPAHYKRTKYDNFEVLINKGHLGKIAWQHWRKFSAGIPVGAIYIDDGAYIAKHRVPAANGQTADGAGSEQRGADYNLGRLEPLGLGKITVIENEREKHYDEGEVLIETEPFRYELRDIKLDKIRTDMRENITELASLTLVSPGDKYGVVESVMSYAFDYVQNWGTHEGAARGLPTKIYEKDATVPAEINWGLKYSEKRSETKSVHTHLWPGTALNVTLRGYYVTLEAPYTAKLHAFYYGSDESVSRKISAEVRKSYLREVKLEFSPVYWVENGTLVPTTTTTTTSTTSTTTRATTTSTHEPTPMHEPPVVHLSNVGSVQSGPDTLEKTLHESVSSNEIPSDVPENLADQRQKPAVAGVAVGSGAAATTLSHHHRQSQAWHMLSATLITPLLAAVTLALRAV